MSDRPIRILLVDDHPLVREGIRSLLRGPEFEIVGEAGDGAAAVELAERFRPDLALLDIRMPGMDGLEALRNIRARSPRTAVVLVTQVEEEGPLLKAVELGVAGYIVKGSPGRELREMVLRVAAGEPGLSPERFHALLERFRAQLPERAAAAAAGARLSPKEVQVLRLVAQGLSNQEIGDLLSLEVSTVKSHIHSLLEKLELPGRLQAALWAVREGLLPEP